MRHVDRVNRHVVGVIAPKKPHAGPRERSGRLPHRYDHVVPEIRYDASVIRRYFDEFGIREWERLERRPMDRINFEMHRRMLDRFVRSGDRVLEIGAGPGRFTIELARIGARVTVTDISPAQLDLNSEKVAAAGAEGAVVKRAVLDVLDLGTYAEETFDATVCYGGALSYVIEQADRALEEMLRVTTPGGYVLLTAMSLLGSVRRYLPDLLEETKRFGLEVVNREVTTGDLPAETTGGQPMRLYRWADLEALLRRHRCELVAASATNFLSVGNDAALAAVTSDEQMWTTFLAWEVSACEQPGALDSGTHIIAVVRKPA